MLHLPERDAGIGPSEEQVSFAFPEFEILLLFCCSLVAFYFFVSSDVCFVKRGWSAEALSDICGFRVTWTQPFTTNIWAGTSTQAFLLELGSSVTSFPSRKCCFPVFSYFRLASSTLRTTRLIRPAQIIVPIPLFKLVAVIMQCHAI